MSVPRFWREIKQRYLMLGSKCRRCRSKYFPPRIVCPNCKEALHKGKPIMEPFEFSGKGKVYSFTRIHVAPPGFENQTPYTMAIVKLDEGPKLTGQIIETGPKKLRIGTPVHAVFRKIREDGSDGVIYYGYKFRPA